MHGEVMIFGGSVKQIQQNSPTIASTKTLKQKKLSVNHLNEFKL